MSEDFGIINMNDVETEEIRWLWEPYIPLGKITLVQGDPGRGKTTLLLAVAAALTTGVALPGSSLAFPISSVLYQTAEDGLGDTIKPRLVQLGADCGLVHVIDEDEAALSLSDERIERAILRTGAKLFILDPLQAYLGDVDMHRANGVRPVFKQLGLVAERTACAIVIIGHLNKSGGKSQYRGLGSIDIHAACRSVLTVGRIPIDDNMRAVVHGKSNLAPNGPSLAFGLDPNGGFTWLGEYEITLEELLKGGQPQPGNQFSRARALIEEMLSRGPVPAVDMMQAAEERGISPKTLHRAKSALGVRSFKQNGQWYWELTIEVTFADVEDGQDGQDGQGTGVTTLAILPGREG
jgi:hypothetical protein